MTHECRFVSRPSLFLLFFACYVELPSTDEWPRWLVEKGTMLIILTRGGGKPLGRGFPWAQ